MWWSCHLMRRDCLCCVMSRDAMRCHAMCAHVMCPAMVTLCVRSGSVTMWWSKVLFCTTKYYCVLQSTTPVLLCTTMYYSSTTLYYKVLQRTTPVLLCTTPVLLCTAKYYSCATKYYSSTTLYCKVLLQYCSVLQSTTTPVLLCTTKYYSSTTLYCKELLQYYSVLQRTTPVLLCTTLLPCTTKYNSRTTLYCKALLQYYSVLQTSQDKFTKYCACHAKWIPWLIRVTHETSFTMRGATRVTLQLHQILRLPRKMNLMIDPPHKWNVIYNARSNKSHPVTSANTAPATQNDSHDWSASHMKHHLQCAEQQESASNFTKYCACHAKWISWLIRVTYETSFRMRGATTVTLQCHQILHLPRNINLMIDPRHIWNRVTYETSFTMRGASKVTL